MNKRVVMVVFALLLLGCVTWAAEKSWSGVISDSNCGLKHAKASDAAAACVAKCVEGGAKYVLVSQGKLYQLTPQDKINAKLAGRNAKIEGTLSGDTITVTSAAAAAAKQAK